MRLWNLANLDGKLKRFTKKAGPFFSEWPGSYVLGSRSAYEQCFEHRLPANGPRGSGTNLTLRLCLRSVSAGLGQFALSTAHTPTYMP